jgi:hypothetical protein
MRIADTWVVSLSAAIAISRINVSTPTEAIRGLCGSGANELNSAISMKPKAHLGGTGGIRNSPRGSAKSEAVPENPRTIFEIVSHWRGNLFSWGFLPRLI